MDGDRLEELFRAYRYDEISEEEWIEKTTPRERMCAVMQHGDPDEGEILTMEQLVVAAEISDRATAPDDVDTVDPEDIDGPDDYPDPDELPDDPPDIDVQGLNARREMLDMATQKTRFTLIQGILSHPEELPSLRELELMNPTLGRTTIHEHLEKLIGAGVVERVENHDTSDNPDMPSKFYGLTDQGRAVLEGTGLIDAEETLKQYYNALKKTEEHDRHENAPRR